MIYVSREFKEAFLSAAQKDLVLTFDEGTVIDNDDIALESMDLEQTLCDADELRFGKVSSACFKTKIIASAKSYKNLWFEASIGVGEHVIKLGRFKVYSDNMTSDRAYREIVAYDALFWAVNTDVTAWYNELVFPITQKEFRDSLFALLGIEQEAVVLPNDNITFSRTVDAENLTGLTVLQKLCEINATWGVCNNVGQFRYVRMRTHEHDALYPNDDLYPSNTLFPNEVYDDKLSREDYYQGTLRYEEYDTHAIAKVTIRENAKDVGYSYGSDGNTYVIEDNFLLYGASDLVLQTVAENFYGYAQYLAYTPSELSCKGAPWREVGDLLRIVADKRILVMPILNRKLSGITALKDSYIAKGTETYGEVKNGTAEQLKQLRSRTNKLTRSQDETRSEISQLETKLEEDYSTTTQMNSVISQTAEDITSTVAKNQHIWLVDYETYTVDVYGYGRPADNNAQINHGKYYLDQEDGTLYTTFYTGVRYVWTEVAQFKSVQDDMYSKIEQNAYGISQKVSKNDVISEINQSAEEVTIKADKISLEGIVSANKHFRIDENGSMEAVDGKFSGTITGGSIEIIGTTTQQKPYIFLQSPTNESKYVDVSHDGITVVDYMDITDESYRCQAVIRTESDDGWAEMNGAFVEAFAFQEPSLKELKKSFEPLNNALNIVKAIDIYKYHYKGEADTKKKHIGLVIGDDFKYSKEVTSNENTSVDLYSLTGVCVKAINELIQIVDEQSKHIEELKERMEA